VSEDAAVRMAAFRFLEEQTARHGEVLDWPTLTKGFSYGGTRVALIGQTGIWKPAALDLPISIATAPPKPGRPAPYEDEVRGDGLLVYRYRGTSPQEPDNVRLREVFQRKLPLIYFHGIDRGWYRPFWPAVIAEDHPAELHVAVELYPESTAVDLGSASDGDLVEKSYARRLTLQRLHQPAFRQRVLRAYRQCCAVCRLKHAELLDAAHILADSDPRSLPVVDNGMALCKIHHAAFDSHILGVRPDYVIEIREDVRAERDGPMLRHGLQELHGTTLVLPRRPAERPNQGYLEERFADFRQAS
jgi:putative restriction endonuclease